LRLHSGRGLARPAWLTLQILSALITIGVVVIALVSHFESHDPAPIPGEGKRIVAFRQVTNRICTEHGQDVHRAFGEATSRVQLLSFLARAIGWDLNDLEAITAPPTRMDEFLSEVQVRRRVGVQVLRLQQGLELGKAGEEARATAALETLESESAEHSRTAGIVRCTRVLPRVPDLVEPQLG
jgi:hypothetical protein